MTDEKCENCFYYYAGKVECRRNAPSGELIKTSFGAYINGSWPTIQEDDWCGEFTEAAIKTDKENDNEH